MVCAGAVPGFHRERGEGKVVTEIVAERLRSPAAAASQTLDLGNRGAAAVRCNVMVRPASRTSIPPDSDKTNAIRQRGHVREPLYIVHLPGV